MNTLTVQEAWDKFKLVRNQAQALFVPIVIRRRRLLKPWKSLELTSLIRRKRKHWTAFKAFPTIERLQLYKLSRNQVTGLIRKLKTAYEEKLCKLSDSKGFYRYLNATKKFKALEKFTN